MSGVIKKSVRKFDDDTPVSADVSTMSMERARYCCRLPVTHQVPLISQSCRETTLIGCTGRIYELFPNIRCPNEGEREQRSPASRSTKPPHRLVMTGSLLLYFAGRIRRIYELFPTSEAPKEETGDGGFQDAEEEPDAAGPTTTGRVQGCRDFLRPAIR